MVAEAVLDVSFLSGLGLVGWGLWDWQPAVAKVVIGTAVMCLSWLILMGVSRKPRGRA